MSDLTDLPDNDPPTNSDPINKEIVEEIATHLRPLALSSERQSALRERVMAGISRKPAMTTIRSTDGEWIPISPLAAIRLLASEGPAKSFLVRMAAGASLPSHFHEGDEECFVLEGEAKFGDLIVQAGDYHIARKGSSHGTISSESGALMFIRSGSFELPLSP